MEYIIGTLFLAIVAWFFIKFFGRWYPGLHLMKQRAYLSRFFFAGLLTLPLLYLVTWIWLPAYLPETGYVLMDTLFFDIFITGATEEICKFFIFWLFAESWKSIKEPKDGLVQAACVALAFASIENFVYMFRYSPEVLLYRAFFTTAGHIGYTAMSGWAWAKIRGRLAESEQKHALRFSAGYIFAASVLHGLHNSFANYGQYLPMMLCNLTAIFLTLFLLQDAEESSPLRRFTLWDWMEASRRLTARSKKDPHDWVSRQRAGIYLIYGGNYRAAIRSLYEAERIRDDLPYARGYLAATRILAGDDSGIFPLKLALYEMPDNRRQSFVHTLRKVARHAPRWPQLDANIKGGAAKPAAP